MTKRILFEDINQDMTIYVWWRNTFDRDFSSDWAAAKDTQKAGHNYIERQITIQGKEYTVFSSPMGYRVDVLE